MPTPRRPAPPDLPDQAAGDGRTRPDGGGASRHGVTLHQYTALSLLERRDGLSSAQLARRHFVTPQAMNQLVASLERDGLIRREPDSANRKILRASLTDGGRAALAACHRAVDDLEQRMLAGFTPTQAGEFRDALERSLRGLADSA